MKQNKKMIATAYIHLIKDKDGNIEKVYGYDNDVYRRIEKNVK